MTFPPTVTKLRRTVGGRRERIVVPLRGQALGPLRVAFSPYTAWTARKTAFFFFLQPGVVIDCF